MEGARGRVQDKVKAHGASLLFPVKYTFANEEADLRVNELLHAVPLSGHEAQHRQEGLDVTQSPLLILQFLLLRRLVHTGEHIGLGVTEHVEEWLILCTVPQHLGERVTVSPHRAPTGAEGDSGEDKSSHTERLAMSIYFLSLPSVHHGGGCCDRGEGWGKAMGPLSPLWGLWMTFHYEKDCHV